MFAGEKTARVISWSIDLFGFPFGLRSKMQVKYHEQALAELAGPNWKVNFITHCLLPGLMNEDFRGRVTSRSQHCPQDGWIVQFGQLAVPRIQKTDRLQAFLARRTRTIRISNKLKSRRSLLRLRSRMLNRLSL
jgi:hypothetical protein